MNKDIIKDKDNSKAVTKAKTDINKEQAEDSRKKAVKSKKSAESVIRDNTNEPEVHIKDYSGKIKYDGKKAIKNTETDIVKPKDTSGIVRTDTAEKIVKPKDTPGIVKADTSTKIVKPENTSEVVKPKDTIQKEKTGDSIYIGKNNYNVNKSKQSPYNKRNITSVGNNKPYKYGNLSTADIVKHSNDNVIESDNEFKTVIIDHSQESKLSKTARDYISEDSKGIGQNPENAPKKALDKAREKIREERTVANDTNLYGRDKKENALMASTNDNKYAYSSFVHSYDANVTEPVAYNYRESSQTSVIKPENTANDIIRTSDTDDIIRDIVLSENKLASAVNPEKTKSNLPKAGKKTSGIGYKIDRKSKNSRKNTESNVFSYGKEAVGNSVESGIRNSDDDGLKTMGAIVGAAVTTAEILKPEDVTPPRRKKFDKAKTGKQTAALGIKKESVGYLKTAVLQAEKSSEKAIRAAGSSVLGIIKSDIEEKAENNLAFKAVDDTIKTIDTAVAVEKGITSAVNTGVTVNKVIKESGKSAVKGGKAVITAPKYLKNKVKRIQKLMRMKRTAQYKLAGKSVKEAAKTTADIIVSSAKDAAIKLGAVMLLCVVLVVMVCGVVFAAIGSFIWQTPTPLDTTQILKYISELDTKQQNNWYEGKTGVDIAKSNSGDSRKYEYYHYLIAEDVPIDVETPENTDFNCLVTVGFNSRGEEISPSFRGFNKNFSSCDEMLECYRWTTDDYRAALAYLQVKNENLGWFAAAIGWIGEYQLKSAAKELHEKTYKQYIVVENRNSDGISDYSYVYPIYSTSYSSDTEKHTYRFGRKFSVKYLIDNDIVRFSDDDVKNETQKERFDYTYKYGNFAVSMLSFPLELSPDEKISDRITKHFGKQLSLRYTPPNRPDDSSKDVFGTVIKNETYHYATDISADDGDMIFSPIAGLCKATQRDERGYEYVISTSYNGNDFDFTKPGYLVKISCSSSSFVGINTPTEVKRGQGLGRVAHNISANYNIPLDKNDTENEDIFADKLFPCSTSTDYHSIEENEFDIPEPSTDHIHMELYKLPCDFTDANSIEENVLAPELFFDYSNETD